MPSVSAVRGETSVTNWRHVGDPERRVTIELFGNARLLAGRSCVDLNVPEKASAAEVAERLARVEPALVGEVIDPDRGLLSSYILNLNGTCFMSSETRQVMSGDRILLFSSQAGG